jgi:hypothetical protein
MGHTSGMPLSVMELGIPQQTKGGVMERSRSGGHRTYQVHW